MKLRLVAWLCLGALTVSASAKNKTAAASPGSPAKPGTTGPDLALEAARPFDKNLDGKIDGMEIDVLREYFTAHRDSPLKKYDTNQDGKLDDVEISLIHFSVEKVGGKPKKKGGRTLKN